MVVWRWIARDVPVESRVKGYGIRASLMMARGGGASMKVAWGWRGATKKAVVI